MPAYRSGAVAVLPPAATPADLEHAVLHSRPAPATAGGGMEIRRAITYGPEQVIETDAGSVVEVVSGAVAMRARHPDGSEVMMGVFGPGEVAPANLPGLGRFELSACCAEARVRSWSWNEALLSPGYAGKVRRLVGRLGAWAALQATPQAEDRLLGLLALLAGVGEDATGKEWGLVDYRLTHQQLAQAIRTTRPTVSRSLGRLKASGAIRVAGSGENRRIYVRGGLDG